MANNGAVTKTLNAGESYTIPAGYHNGSGKVTVNSLASQTEATATNAQIISGQTAWVNGNKITGTMVNNGELNWKPTTNTTYTVEPGYYSGGTLDSSGAYNAGYAAGKTDSTSSIIDLGTGTSFNVSGYEGYQNFTVNNFLIAPSTSASASNSSSIIPTYSNTSTMKVSSSSSITSSYNKSTGVFSCRLSLSASTSYSTSSGSAPSASSSGSVHAYLILN